MSMFYGSLPDSLQQLLAVIDRVAPAPVYLVGGIVRDMLLGCATADHDLDLITEADAPSVVAALVAQLGGSQTTHSRFATATWHLPPDLSITITHTDFATTRTEAYAAPAQLPDVTVSTIEHDLARRDFTINAMALPLNGGSVLDPHNGQADLANSKLRLLNEHSLRDDPTRLLRAARFEQRFVFTFAPNLIEQIPDALRYLPDVTGPRIWNELEKVSAESNPPAIMSRLAELGVFEKMVPGLGWDQVSATTTSSGGTSGQVESYARLASLRQEPTWQSLIEATALPELHAVLWLHPQAKAVQQATFKRLHLRSVVSDTLHALSKLLPTISSYSHPIQPSVIDKTLNDYANSPLPLITLRCLLTTHPIAPQLDQWQREWRHLRLTINGHDLRQLGLPPGPAYRDILSHVRAMRLDGELDSAEEQSYLAKLASAYLADQ